MPQAIINSYLMAAAGPPLPDVWLDASQESYADGTLNPTFTDFSGNTRNYIATATGAGTEITFRVGLGPNGNDLMRYVASGRGHESTINLAGLGWVAAEIFMVLRVDPTAVAPSLSGLMRIGNDASADFYPFVDDRIYSTFAASVRKDFPNPVDLTQWHILNISSAAGSWTLRIDGVDRFTTAVNTFQLANPQTNIGVSAGPQAFVGDITETLLYGRDLSVADRAAALLYLQTHHGL